MLSVNDQVQLWRRRYYSPGEGSDHPLTRLMDAMETTVSVGVRQLSCELGLDAISFARGVRNLKDAAQVTMSEGTFRKLVVSEGKAVLKVSREEQLELDWSASDCKTTTPGGQEVTRLNVSADGVLVPTVTQAEKEKHRQTVPPHSM